MDKQAMINAISIEGVEPLIIDGQELSAEVVKSTIYSRIWRSAVVNKNKRQADKGGVKVVVSQALKEGLIKRDDAVDLLLMGSKEEINALKEQLPKVEKDDLPSKEDVELAIKQTFSNKGQA